MQHSTKQHNTTQHVIVQYHAVENNTSQYTCTTMQYIPRQFQIHVQLQLQTQLNHNTTQHQRNTTQCTVQRDNKHTHTTQDNTVQASRSQYIAVFHSTALVDYIAMQYITI